MKPSITLDRDMIRIGVIEDDDSETSIWMTLEEARKIRDQISDVLLGHGLPPGSTIINEQTDFYEYMSLPLPVNRDGAAKKFEESLEMIGFELWALCGFKYGRAWFRRLKRTTN